MENKDTLKKIPYTTIDNISFVGYRLYISRPGLYPLSYVKISIYSVISLIASSVDAQR